MKATSIKTLIVTSAIVAAASLSACSDDAQDKAANESQHEVANEVAKQEGVAKSTSDGPENNNPFNGLYKGSYGHIVAVDGKAIKVWKSWKEVEPDFMENDPSKEAKASYVETDHFKSGEPSTVTFYDKFDKVIDTFEMTDENRFSLSSLNGYLTPTTVDNLQAQICKHIKDQNPVNPFNGFYTIVGYNEEMVQDGEGWMGTLVEIDQEKVLYWGDVSTDQIPAGKPAAGEKSDGLKLFTKEGSDEVTAVEWTLESRYLWKTHLYRANPQDDGTINLQSWNQHENVRHTSAQYEDFLTLAPVDLKREDQGGDQGAGEICN